MAKFANILAAPGTDGIKYAVNVPLTASEVDIYSTLTPHPIPVNYNEAIEAIITLTAQGMTFSSAYVILQTDLGDGNWIDVAGCRAPDGATGAVVFTLSAGVAGANVVQQTRQVGTAPAANFSNQITLGGRLRFVGSAKSSGSSSSSSSSGNTVAQILATVLYKQLGLR